MSLIQEALRRQQEEATGPTADRKPASPAAAQEPPPAPQPPPVVAPRADQPLPKLAPSAQLSEAPQARNSPMAQSVVVDATSRRALPTILGMAVLLLVLAALGGWLVWYGFRQWTAKPTPAAATATEVRPRPDPVAPPASTAVTPPPLAVKTPVKPAPSAAALPAPSNPQPAMAMQPVPAEALAAKPAASPAAAVNPASPAAAVVPEKTAWPVLNVSGLVGKGARGAAIINRQVVGVDETIEGARVISIERQGVKIEFQGETQLFKVGSAGR